MAFTFADTPLPQVFGRYLLVQRLSRGGMGEIFLAKYGLSGFEKLCVIKKILPHLSQDDHFISRFVDEAQVALRLQHANIAQLLEVGRVSDEYFLAFEFIEGRDLSLTMRALHEQRKRMPPELALLIGRDLANGLSYAHRRKGPDGMPLRLVHCDISPPNVIVSFEGEVKVIDFGISRSAMRVSVTNPKVGFGKFGYMAPEQLLRGGAIDYRTDIYGAGAVLYELLTGQRLYLPDSEGENYRSMAKKVIRGEHAMPSQIEAALAPYDSVIARALATDKDQRHASAADLRDALQTLLVQISPTLSADALAAFMRDLFAQELEEARRMSERARATDLRDWQKQLADQSSVTVSFAQSAPNDPLSLVRDDASASSSMSAQKPAVRHPAEDAVTERSVPRFARTSRRLLALAVLALLMFVSGGVLAILLGDTRMPAEAPPVPVPASPTAEGAAAPGKSPEPAELPEEPDTPEAPEAPDAKDDSEVTGALQPAEPAVVAEDASSVKPHESADVPQTQAPKTAAPSQRTGVRPSRDARRDAVQAGSRDFAVRKFREISKEYGEFRKSYGGRLESEWADLVHQVQYESGPDPERMSALSEKLDGFRAKMRAIRQQTESGAAPK